MKFAQSTWILASLSWISFTSWSMAVAMPSPPVSSQQPRDGISVACQMQPIDQIHNSSDRHAAIVNLFERYINKSFTTITNETPTGLRTGQTAQTLQLIAALPPQEEMEMKAQALLWLASVDRGNGDQAKAIPLLSQL